MTYEGGVAIAFGIAVVKTTTATYELFTTRYKNLEHVNLTYSFGKGNYIDKDKIMFMPLWARWTGFVGYLLLITPWFSWLSVASTCLCIILWLVNKQKAPEEVSRARWLLSTIEMNQKDVQKLLQQIMLMQAKKLNLV